MTPYGNWFSKRSRTDPLAVPIAEHLRAKMMEQVEKATREVLWNQPPPAEAAPPPAPAPAPETPTEGASEVGVKGVPRPEYTLAFKRQVVAEALASDSKEEVRKKHDISNASFYLWMKKPEYQPGSTSTEPANKVGRNYTPEFKAQVVGDMLLARATGKPGAVLDVLKRHGISEQTGYAWTRAAEVKPGRWGRGSALPSAPPEPTTAREEDAVPKTTRTQQDMSLKPGDKGYIYPEEIRTKGIEAVKAAREAGTPDADALAPLGLNINQVMGWARERGVSIPLRRVDLPDAEKALWLGRLEQSGLTVNAFAAKHADVQGLSEGSLRRWKAKGIKPAQGPLWRDGRSDPKPPAEGKVRHPDRLRAEAYAAFGRSEKVGEIAARLGVPKGTIYAWQVTWKRDQPQVTMSAQKPPAFPAVTVRGQQQLLPPSMVAPLQSQPRRGRPPANEDELMDLREENVLLKGLLNRLARKHGIDLSRLFTLGE